MKSSKFKSLLSVLLCFVLAGSVVICGFAAEEKSDYSQDEIYAELISKGCPEELFEDLTDGARRKLGDNIGEYAVGDVEYIPDYQIDNDGKNVDYVNADVLKIGLEDKETGDFKGVALCVFWELEKKPLIKDDDFITFLWNGTANNIPYKFVYAADSFYAEDLSDDGSVVNEYNSLAYAGSNEIGHYTDISKASGGIAVFRLNSASDEDVKELSELFFKMNYVHKTETLGTVSAIALPMLLVAIIIVAVVMYRRRKKNIK